MSGVAAALAALGGGPADEEVVHVLQSLRDSASAAGPRYDERTMRALTRTIVARAYAPTLLELSHLLGPAERLGGRYGAAGFFWGVEPARPAGFRAAAEAAPPSPGWSPEATGIAIRYGDGAFVAHYGRMPLLAALYEFLVVAIGYEAVAAAARRPMTRAAAEARAGALSRALYAWLRGRLPTATHQRLHRRMVAHLVRERGPEFRLEDVDDAAVLSFWAGGGFPDRAGEVRSYRAVALAFLRFRRAFRSALERRALADAMAIGPDRAAGEVDPGAAEPAAPGWEEEPDRLEALEAAPLSAIAFLNKRERERIGPLARHGADAAALALTIVRAGVFGDLQARLTEARRRGGGRRRMAAAIRDGPAETYAARLAALEAIADRLALCRLACLHVLLRHRMPDAVALLRDLFPDADLGPAAAAAREGRRGFAEAPPIRPDALLDGLARPGSPAAAEGREAARAFARVSRRGFGEAEAADPAHADLFRRAVPLLEGLAAALAAFLARARAALPPDARAAAFERDRAVFARVFRESYGASDD